MRAIAYTTLDTALGACSIAWRDAAVVQLVLPAATTDLTIRRVLRHHPDATPQAPPPLVQDAITAVQAHLAGSTTDLSHIPIDVATAPDFDQRVWAETRRIPPGDTRTYGQVARALGDVALSRDVGQALGRNPVPLIVPCHRVLASDGALHGFSAPGGIETKRRLLRIERAPAVAQGSLFDP